VCLPLLLSPCTIKSRSSLLAPAHPGGPGKRAVKQLWWCGISCKSVKCIVGAFHVLQYAHKTMCVGQIYNCNIFISPAGAVAKYCES